MPLIRSYCLRSKVAAFDPPSFASSSKIPSRSRVIFRLICGKCKEALETEFVEDVPEKEGKFCRRCLSKRRDRVFVDTDVSFAKDILLSRSCVVGQLLISMKTQ